MLTEVLSEWATSGWLGYLAVALGAATPWLEILVVIPPAILLDLDPVVVAVVAFVGNFAPIAAIVVAYERVVAWRARRRTGPRKEPGPRAARASRLLRRYGVPGLAVLGPLVTGIHLAVLLAMATGAPRARVLGWSGASLALWSVAITVASVAGRGLLPT